MQLSELIPNLSEVIPYEYSSIKNPEYDRIIASYLDKSSSLDNPKIIHMAGIPGAGKTTFYRTHQWGKHIFIAFDDIMESLSSYQQDLTLLGNAAAFAKWELPARIIGYELLRLAVEQKKNIFFDNGGSSLAHIQLMQNIKNFGYSTEMYYISCSLDTAIARSIVREKEINRHIPIETIKERYTKTLNNIKLYQTIVDNFHHFESCDTGFVQLIP